MIVILAPAKGLIQSQSRLFQRFEIALYLSDRFLPRRRQRRARFPVSIQRFNDRDKTRRRGSGRNGGQEAPGGLLITPVHCGQRARRHFPWRERAPARYLRQCQDLLGNRSGCYGRERALERAGGLAQGMFRGEGRAAGNLGRVGDAVLDGPLDHGKAFGRQGGVVERDEEFIQHSGPGEVVHSKRGEPGRRGRIAFAHEVGQRRCFHAQAPVSQRLDAPRVGVEEE